MVSEGELFKKVESTVKEYHLLKRGDRVVLAVSGGPDSLFLLHSMLCLQPKLDLEIAVAHLNHSLRGKESDQDEVFTRDLTQNFTLPFFSKKINVKTIKLKEKMGLEEKARFLRYQFLEEVRKKWSGDKIATGHTLDDSGETLFFNLLRGTGTTGLGGIPIKRDGIIRPLLFLRRDTIRNYLKEHGITYRIDSTNIENHYTRNFLRNRLFPLLEKRFPGFQERCAQTALLLKEEAIFFEELAQKTLKNLTKKSPPNTLLFDRYKLLKLPQILQKWIFHLGFKSDFKTTARLVKLLKNGGKMQLGKGIKIEVSGPDLYQYRKPIKFKKQVELKIGTYKLPELNLLIKLKKVKRKGEEGQFTAYFPSSQVKLSMVLSGRKTGDKLHLPVGTRSLKKFLIDKKFPRWRRDFLPIIRNGDGKILWIVGLSKSYPRGASAPRIPPATDGSFWRGASAPRGYVKLEVKKLNEKEFWIYD